MSVDIEQVQKDVENFSRAMRSSPDLDTRFTLMSKLFSRALAIPPSEERFLWLWTVLEVFPMMNTTDIQPISEHLASVTGCRPDEVKERLGIGRLYGARCDLVHHGKLPFETAALGSVLDKLQAMT